jgi:hypothetical protein
MKNFVIFFALISLPFTSHSYSWQCFCPASIHANNICFGVGSWKGVICSPEGMYLWEEDIEEWTFYTYGLPVTGAVNLNATQILVAMGCGTYSDGIYTFDLETHQFEVVEWIVTPNFLHIVPVLDTNTGLFTDEFYVGSQFGGLFKTIDGLSWNEVPYFNGKSCTAMDFYGEHLVISEAGNIINIHCSDDYGVNWFEAASATLITDLKFNNSGILYGIFPDYSNSSGLYKSEDFGNNWDVEFWSDNMSAVGFDAVGTIFVGWDSLAGGNEGIAMYNPLAPPPGLTFINNGLASTNINKILLNPVLSSIAIFCCTDAGVYMCNDYLVEIYDNTAVNDEVTIFPNPVSDQATVNINLSGIAKSDFAITFINNSGIKVDEIKFENAPSNKTKFTWNKGSLPAGIYYLVVKTKNETMTEKFIIL